MCRKNMVKDFYDGGAAPMWELDSRNTWKEHSYFEKEDRCLRVFRAALRKYGGIWHLCTPGGKQSLIFRKEEDFVFGMTLVAMCAYDCPDVQIITFELMGNHVHFVLCGSEADVLAFFALFKQRLRKYLVKKGDRTDLSHFACEKPIPVETVESLRNQIGYTNRNYFVVNPDHTPFTYPYGANSYYFLPIAKERQHSRFGELNILKKRAFVHSKAIAYPDSFTIVDGFFSPMNYCRFDIGEGVFRDARHYFHKLSKEIESYREIAATLGDSLFYSDDELSDVVHRICREKYAGQRAVLLNKHEKMELARTLHFDYNAGNASIHRLLNLSLETLQALFPLRRK